MRLRVKIYLLQITTRIYNINELFLSDTEPSAKKEPVRRSSAESQQIGGEFAEFLKSMNKSDITLDVSKQVRLIIERLQSMGEAPIEEYSELVISFYQSMSDRVHTRPMYGGLLNIMSD